MLLDEAIDKVQQQELSSSSVARELLELFDRTAVKLGSFVLASKIAHKNLPSIALHRSPTPAPVPAMADSKEQNLLSLLNNIFQMLQRAHLRANDLLMPFQMRYEVHPFSPFPDLRQASTMAPNLTLSIELRDTGIARRKTQVVRYRISVSRAKDSISVVSLDPKLKLPDKFIIPVDPVSRNIQIRTLENVLIGKLVERARRAFRR